MSNRYYTELSVLSTILFSHHTEHEEYFNSYKLELDWFDTPFHKDVIKAVNFNKKKNIPHQEEYIADLLAKHNKMYPELWFTILSANPFSRPLFDKYIESIKNNHINKAGDI